MFERPLSYRGKHDTRGREKGVDVQIAVDIVRHAFGGAFDCIVLGSADTDLMPALRFVADHDPGIRIITLAWEPSSDYFDAPGALDLGDGAAERLSLGKPLFDRAADWTDYFAS